MSMNQTPRESGANGTCDATAQTLNPLSLPCIQGEVTELFALSEVLLGCEGQFFEMHGSFSVMLGTLVSRLRRLERALEGGGFHD
jgi:hypothetical protein